MTAMKNIIPTIEAEQLRKDALPEFRSGDTLSISFAVKEGDRERLQIFEGLVIAKRNRGLHSSFIVRKISHGEGVERTFPLHSPLIKKIVLKRKGKVRRAKLYYQRDRQGKAARIAEKIALKSENTAKVSESNVEA